MGRLATTDEARETKLTKFVLKEGESAHIVLGLIPIDDAKMTAEVRQEKLQTGLCMEVQVAEGAKTKNVLASVAWCREFIHRYSSSTTNDDGSKSYSNNDFKCLSQDLKVRGSCCAKFDYAGSKSYRKEQWGIVVGKITAFKKGKATYAMDEIEWMEWRLTSDMKDKNSINSIADNVGLNRVFLITCGPAKTDAQFHKYTITPLDPGIPFSPEDMALVFDESNRVLESIDYGRVLSAEEINKLPLQVDSGNNSSKPAPKSEPPVEQQNVDDILDDNSSNDVPF